MGERMAWVALCPDCAACRAALVDDPDSKTRREDATRFAVDHVRQGLYIERQPVESVRAMFGPHVPGCPSVAAKEAPDAAP